MKPKFVSSLITLGGIVLGIAGVCFFVKAGAAYTQQDARWPLMVSGIICLAFGAGLAIAGYVFASRSQD